MNSNPIPNPEPQVEPAFEDEFAYGRETRLNRAFSRLMKWVFTRPHFPTELIWFLLALAVTDIALELLRQRSAYWIDPSVAESVSFVGTPLAWGPLPVLAIYLGYLLLIGPVLGAINRKLAFPIWVVLGLLHLFSDSSYFACWANPPIPFYNTNHCSQWYAAAQIAAGIIWAIALAGLVSLRIIPFNLGQPETEHKPRFNLPAGIKIVSMVWIGLFSLGVTVAAAFPARVEWKPIEAGQASLVRPAGRMYAALAYDTKREKAVLFGGTSAWTQATDWIGLGDTWEWDGAGWHQFTLPKSPSPRYSAVLAYDANRGVMVLFGGGGQDASNVPVFLDDTWEWDGQNWSEAQPATRPPARDGATLYYDPSRQKVVLYGGYSKDEYGQNTFFDDTWEWDGQTWTRITLEKSRAVSSVALLYDERQQLPILMDGQGLWVLKDSRWYQPNYPQTPPGRWAGSLAADPPHQQIILFGGFQGQEIFNDTWTFNGGTWKKTITRQPPPARYGANLFFDLKRKKIVLFGGHDSTTFYNDMWELVQP
jgi:hypothetical protein